MKYLHFCHLLDHLNQLYTLSPYDFIPVFVYLLEID